MMLRNKLNGPPNSSNAAPAMISINRGDGVHPNNN